MLICSLTRGRKATPEKKAGPILRGVWPFRSRGTIFLKMNPLTLHLHNAIRNGLECDCYPSPSLSDGEHGSGCRWAAYKDEIYRIERREEKVKAAVERSAKKFHKALAALAKE